MMAPSRLLTGSALLLAALTFAACDIGPGVPGVTIVPLATVPYVGSPPASFEQASPGASSDTVIPATSWEDFQFHISDSRELTAALAAIAADRTDLSRLDADGAQLGFLAELELTWLAANRPQACWAPVHKLWGKGMAAYADGAAALQSAYDLDDPSLVEGARARIGAGRDSIKDATDESGRVNCD